MKLVKKISAMILIITIAASLAACGSSENKDKLETNKNENDSGENSEREKVNSTEPLSVVIWDSGQQDGLQTIMDDFTEETGIKTEIMVVPWDQYWVLLEAGAQGGDMPDVFWMHANEAERYMSNGMLMDLTDKITESSEIDLANYPKDIVNLYSYEGKSYAIPKDIDTIALWYNKKLFDEAGMDYPTADWTWDDLYDAAKKLTKDDGSQYGYALDAGNGQAGSFNYIYDEGGYVISEDKTKSGYDDPKTIKAMQFFEKMIQDGIMPNQDIMAESGEFTLFSNGKIAMIAMGSWMVQSLAQNEYVAANCDCIELPKSAATGRRCSIYNGLGWAVSANSERQLDAWKLVEYLGGEAAQKKQAELGVTMSAYEGASESWTDCADFNLDAYLNMMDDLVINPYSKQTVLWTNIITEELTKAWMQEISMEEACKTIASEMNEILAEEKE